MPPRVLFVVIAATAVLYGIIGAWALRRYRTEPSNRLRTMALVLFLCAAAFVVSALQRLGLQAIRSGWLSVNLTDDLLGWWQLVQSIVLLGVGFAAILATRRAWSGISHSEQVVTALGAHAQVDIGDLTPRERDVLRAIGVGTLSDKDIASQLGISRHTVKTHVSRILSKTGLHRREELLVVAALLRSEDPEVDGG